MVGARSAARAAAVEQGSLQRAFRRGITELVGFRVDRAGYPNLAVTQRADARPSKGSVRRGPQGYLNHPLLNAPISPPYAVRQSFNSNIHSLLFK